MEVAERPFRALRGAEAFRVVSALESDPIASRDGEDHLGFYRTFYVKV